jgi:DNA-binding GntR family transcriptional regulator
VARELVKAALPSGTRLTAKQLREATGIPRRTLFTVLDKMADEGLLASKDAIADTRQRLFWLTQAPQS